VSDIHRTVPWARWTGDERSGKRPGRAEALDARVQWGWLGSAVGQTPIKVGASMTTGESAALNYPSYVALATSCLGAQRPRSEEHGELPFVVTHQV
jgi:hypothetical protein